MSNTNELNPVAKEINKKIIANNKYIYEMFSEEGKRMYMPKGVLSQSAQAKAKKVKYNATIGIAKENGKPMYLECINKYFNMENPAEIYPYAPSTGVKELREAWKKGLYRKNPALNGKEISLPVTTIGLTHAITISSSLFVDIGDTVIVPDKMWGNYNLIIKERKKANLISYKLFNDDMKLNIEGIKETFTEQAKKNEKLMIILNFPNNPSGYTPTEKEAKELVEVIKSLPEYDCNVIAVFDDAYFGLFYEDDIYKQSIFSELANASERILAVKGDATTKENYVWGFRVGFITYGTKAINHEEIYSALENKTSGVIRGTVSSPPHALQRITEHALNSNDFLAQKQEKSDIMKARYEEVKRVAYDKKYEGEWRPYPFNSGYFMCLKLNNVNSEQLRVHLLDNYSLGIISTSPTDVRIAFSCLEKSEIETVFDLIYKGITDLKK